MILDKGLVIDLYLRVSLVGIEILTVDARIVIASVDTYLRFAEAVGRLDIKADDEAQGLPQLIESMTSGGAESKTKGALEGIKDKIMGSDDDEDSDGGDSGGGSQRSRSRSGSSSPRSSGSRSSGSRSSGSRSSGSSSSGSRSRSRSSGQGS